MKKYLLNLLVGIIAFFSLTELVFAETTMSEEGQYIFNSLAFYIGGVLVAITAEPLMPSPVLAMVIGAVIMYFGTLVVPLSNSDTSFGTQFIGVISVVAFSFVLSYVAFRAMKSTIGLRISKAAEKLGTDKAEIGVTAYSIRDE